MRIGRVILACVVAGLWAGGCARVPIEEPVPIPAAKDYYRPLPPGAFALRPITDPAKLPNFSAGFPADRAALLQALDRSIQYFGMPSSERYFPIGGITHARAARSLVAFRELLSSAQSGTELHAKIISAFDVYESVGCDNEGTVLFTGYYTPVFEASLTPSDEFKYALYKLPSDLARDNEGKCLGRKLPDGSLTPYYSRAEIEAGALKGNELVYLKDRFEAYICTVQGSAQLKLRDGARMNIGYAGNNGKDYTSVGRLLVDAGLLPQEQLSLEGLAQFFKKDPAALDQYLAKNERYIFFQQSHEDARGSLGLLVTPYVTLATDKIIFPRGCLTFVRTEIPDAAGDMATGRIPFERFMLDQDTGNAIRAAGRADIYLGVGEKAGQIAGWTMREGRLYYLFLKEEGAPAK